MSDQQRRLDNELLLAAINLLAAKDVEMLTASQWGDLRLAVARASAHRDRIPLQEPLATGTQVVHPEEGECAAIMNGFAFDRTGEWTEYEVETVGGIERWKRIEFVLMSETEINA